MYNTKLPVGSRPDTPACDGEAVRLGGKRLHTLFGSCHQQVVVVCPLSRNVTLLDH